jgi:hypothetical protein
MQVLGTTIKTKAAMAAAVAALAAGAVGAAAAAGGDSANSFGSKVEAQVDACRASIPTGGIGKCVSAWVREHNHGDSVSDGKAHGPKGPSAATGAEGKSEVNHGQSAANGGAGSATAEGQSDSTTHGAPASPGKSASHKP